MKINFYISPPHTQTEIWGRYVQGTKRPVGAKRPGGETSRGGNGFGAKRPGTDTLGQFRFLLAPFAEIEFIKQVRVHVIAVKSEINNKNQPKTGNWMPNHVTRRG